MKNILAACLSALILTSCQPTILPPSASPPPVGTSLPPPPAERRVTYIASVGDVGDGEVLDAIKSKLSSTDAYFARLNYVNLAIDAVRFEDRGNETIDYVVTEGKRYSAQLVLLFRNPYSDGEARVSLELYCVQNSEFIASDTERRIIRAETGGTSRALENAAKASLDDLMPIYVRRVEGEGYCPFASYQDTEPTQLEFKSN